MKKGYYTLIQILLIFAMFVPSGSVYAQSQQTECSLTDYDQDQVWEILSRILTGTNDLASGIYEMATTEAGNNLFQRIADEKLEIYISIPQYNFDGVLYDIPDEESVVAIRVADSSENIELDGQYVNNEIVFNSNTRITPAELGRAIAHELVHALDDKLGRLDVELEIALPHENLGENIAANVAWTEFLRLQIQLKIESEVRAYRMQMAMANGCAYNDVPSADDMWIALFDLSMGEYAHYADYYSQGYEAVILEYTGTAVWPKIGLEGDQVTLELVLR